MPIENELKYVLKKDCESDFRDYFYLEIIQGYLVAEDNKVVRIRKTNSKIQPLYDTHYLTFKMNVNNKCIEIEQEISESDFEELITQCTNLIYKKRYTISNINLDLWTVDFIKNIYSSNPDNVYLVLAEVEMPEERSIPQIPSIIRKNIIYSVPREDLRFSNSKLHDISYVEKLVKTIC